ncbi:GGDEF domain-containing protein [Desulfurobacterium atlanticum]|uniref:diguanylate cyclase n=1 Tax=Desulfurobacterium atlanticum TaxID=240169 RepID=A0A238YH60_9BACT|nr:GGDEF domain-containing protein [Desulfurobacterium atlanticum]SNR70467.1 diguanylate cyclase (GGDEF) domain-containing protein [Desulfurobacterium atlanticum]
MKGDLKVKERVCEFLDGCLFPIFINDDEVWEKIETMFCKSDYKRCRRYVRRKQGYVVPVDLWPMDNETISELVYQLKFSLKNAVDKNRKTFAEFKNSFYYLSLQNKIDELIKADDIDEKHKKFLERFLSEFYSSLFIKDFDEAFFVKMAHFYVKSGISSSIFDPVYLVFSSELFEKFYKWSLETINDIDERIFLLSVVVKYSNFAYSFLKKNATMIQNLDLCFDAFLKLKEKEKQAFVDALTGVYNRNYLELLSSKLRKDYNYVIFIDLDDFKLVNDNFGHDVGDEVLKKVGEILQSCLRNGDIAVRYGGDEFLVVLNVPDGSIALKVAERIERKIKDISILTEKGKVSVSASIGVSKVCCAVPFIENIKEADKALYKAKEQGKGKIFMVC